MYFLLEIKSIFSLFKSSFLFEYFYVLDFFKHKLIFENSYRGCQTKFSNRNLEVSHFLMYYNKFKKYLNLKVLKCKACHSKKLIKQ